MSRVRASRDGADRLGATSPRTRRASPVGAVPVGAGGCRQRSVGVGLVDVSPMSDRSARLGVGRRSSSGRGSGRAGVRGSGSTRDGEPDRLAEALAEGVLERRAQPALELVAGELVGDGDDRGALVQRQRLAGAQPGPLVGRRSSTSLRQRTSSVRAVWSTRPAFACSTVGCFVPALCTSCRRPSSLHTFVHRLCTGSAPCAGRALRRGHPAAGSHAYPVAPLARAGNGTLLACRTQPRIPEPATKRCPQPSGSTSPRRIEDDRVGPGAVAHGGPRVRRSRPAASPV